MAAPRRFALIQHAVLAAIAYLPLLATARGQVVADTKTYLYVDPARLLARAPWMWDPTTGFGTVSHQTIGYLFPMGPWFWFFERIGAPDWVAQRLWLGTILFAAGAGVLFLIRTLDAAQRIDALRGRIAVAAFVGAIVYMLTPHSLQYASRLSALLLPWAGLPWMVALAHRALRRGGWRHPALFALVVLAIGSVNAAALMLAGIGPLLWIAFATFVHHEVTPRVAAAAVLRIGLLTSACSVWWVVGLLVQGSYGVEVLRYSETLQTVAATSIASEVLRGLGYWFFYGGDKVGPWTEQGPRYASVLWLLVATFAVPALAIGTASLFRWRYRAFAVVLIVIGTAISVGAYPYGNPPPAGALFKYLSETSSAWLALRSTPRAVPLIALGFALAMFAGLSALSRSRPRVAIAASVATTALAMIAMEPLFTGGFLSSNLLRDEQIPDYWHEAAEYLDSRPHTTRVLELPGADFAAYRWGQTVDPITPGLIDRPYAARELIPQGSAGTADLLNAFDRRLQDGQFDPEAVAPVARLMGVGDVVVRSDLEYERFRTPRPRQTWALFFPPPEGLAKPKRFGPEVPNRPSPRFPLQDVLELVTPPEAPHPPPVAAFPVIDATSIVDTTRTQRPLLVSGDGEGVVHAASYGILDADSALLYSAALADQRDVLDDAIDSGARLLITDTNRRRARQWRAMFETFGYTEPRGSQPLEPNPADNRLPLFPSAGDDAFTAARHEGVEEVTATSYGNPVTYTPENRAVNAFDGDPETAWRAGDFNVVTGERIEVTLKSPVDVDSIEVVQPLVGARNRFITRVRVRLDGRSIGTFRLDESSRTLEGQQLNIGGRRFRRLSLEVVADNVGKLDNYRGMSPVGFAEIRIPGVSVREVIDLPRDLLSAAGSRSTGNELMLLFERLRLNPLLTTRQDEELSMIRGFRLPTRRSFSLQGEARLTPSGPAQVTDLLLGIPDAAHGGTTVSTSSVLHASLANRGSAAIDGDERTAWRTGFREDDVVDSWIEVELPAPVTVGRMDLAVIADGQHSVPTRLHITAGGSTRVVDVPRIEAKTTPNSTVSVPLEFAPLTGTTFRVEFVAVDPAFSVDYFDETPIMRPLGVAELGFPGIRRPTARRVFDSGCRPDLIHIDDKPVPVRIRGTHDRAEARDALRVELCSGTLDLPAGEHVLRVATGKTTGMDIDGLLLRSDPVRTPTATAQVAEPTIEIESQDRSSYSLTVRGVTKPFWLVLRQSHSLGWKATAEGLGDLGEPTLIDGFANAWFVQPGDATTLDVKLDWAPQRRVWGGLGASALAVIICLGIIAFSSFRPKGLHYASGLSRMASSPALRERAHFDFPNLKRRHAAECALVCGVVSGLVAGLWLGLGVAAAAYVAVRTGRRGRLALAAGAVITFTAAAVLVIARVLWRGGPPPNFTWPSYFGHAHRLAWFAVLLLAADVFVGWFSRRYAPVSPQTAPTPTESPLLLRPTSRRSRARARHARAAREESDH